MLMLGFLSCWFFNSSLNCERLAFNKLNLFVVYLFESGNAILQNQINAQNVQIRALQNAVNLIKAQLQM